MEDISVGVKFTNSAKPENWPRSMICGLTQFSFACSNLTGRRGDTPKKNRYLNAPTCQVFKALRKSRIFERAEAIRFNDTFRFYEIKKYRLAFLCPKIMQLCF